LTDVAIRTDSQLLVDQFNGLSQVRKELLPLAAKGRELRSQFERAKFEWIPGTRNKTADLLAELGRSKNKD